MKIAPLQKLVTDFDISRIEVGNNPPFHIVSDEYQQKKKWFVKGLFEVKKDEKKTFNILVCEKLEEDITITINKPMVNGETIKSTDPDEESSNNEKLQAEANKRFDVRLLHAPSGRVTTTHTVKRSEIPKFVDVSMSKFEVGGGQPSFKKDFFVIRVNFEDKSIDCDRIE